MSLAVCLTSYNRPENLRAILPELLRTAPEADRIVVSIDPSDVVPFDQVLEAIGQPYDGRLRYRVNATRLGSVGNKNAALRLADPHHDHYLLVEDDVMPLRPGWASLMRQLAKESDQALMQRVPTYGGWPARIEERKRACETFPTGTVCWGDWATATVLYVRGDALERVGYFDEGFRRWGHGHVEWQFRFLAAGLVRPIGHPYVSPELLAPYLRDLDCGSSVDDERADPAFKADVEANRQRMDELRREHRRLYA